MASEGITEQIGSQSGSESTKHDLGPCVCCGGRLLLEVCNTKPIISYYCVDQGRNQQCLHYKSPVKCPEECQLKSNPKFSIPKEQIRSKITSEIIGVIKKTGEVYVMPFQELPMILSDKQFHYDIYKVDSTGDATKDVVFLVRFAKRNLDDFA